MTRPIASGMSDQTATPSDGVRLPFNSVKKLLQPLLDVTDCDQMSLTHFKENWRDVIAKMEQTRRPVLLLLPGAVLLLCEPQQFFELESQRRWILHGCKTLEQMIRVGKVLPHDPRVTELASINKSIKQKRAEARKLEWRRKEAERNLAKWEAKAAKLQRDLEQSPPQ